MGAAIPPEIDDLLREEYPDGFPQDGLQPEMQDLPVSDEEIASLEYDGRLEQEHERDLLPDLYSEDTTERQPQEQPGTAVVPYEEEPMSLQDEVGAGDPNDPLARRAMEAMYGSDFPLLDDDADREDWAKWAASLWSGLRAGVDQRLHLVERNRLMRKGIQWISSQGLGPWREPPKPKDSTRAVDNLIKPALDQRLQIITEQRPGFRTRPETQDMKDLKKAEAQQVAVEYQYTQQNMQRIMREACYWAGTDGVSFLHSYWNPDRGQWDEVMVPHKGAQGEDALVPETKPMGDIETEVLRIEEVRVSPDATANKAPSFWVTRKVIPTQQAVNEHGVEVLDLGQIPDYNLQTNSGMSTKFGTLTTLPDALLQDIPTVDRFTIYCERSEYLKQGLCLVVVGNKVVAGPMPLMFGIVPLVRVTDGSTDPNFYPEAIMEGWIDSQMRINVLKSKWIDSIRVNAGGRFLAKENTLSTETLIGGMTSYISVKGAGSLDDSVKAVQGFSVGNDVKELLEVEKKSFEDKSGYNDTSRGSFSADQSGRAILAIREQLERAFAPPVQAASESMTVWAKICLAIMKWGYDYPRMLSIEGQGRPDLARAIGAEDLDGVANVTIDPETLMPMPRALRLFLLDSLLQKGVITVEDYKRRLPFAFTNNLDSTDTDQTARANRVVQAIKETANPNALPLLWQDDEAIHQDILERELILPDDMPYEHPVRQAAIQRWQMLANQSTMKSGGMPPALPSSGGKGKGKPPKLSPQEQPFQGSNPGMAAGTAAQMAGNDSTAASFEGALPQ